MTFSKTIFLKPRCSIGLTFYTAMLTPYNVGSVLWRLFSTSRDNISTVGDASVLWRLLSTVGDSFSTVERQLQDCGSCSVQWGIVSVLWGDKSVL